MIPTLHQGTISDGGLTWEFQSRNRETYDSNLSLVVTLSTLITLTFQSRNRETYDSNYLKRIAVPASSLTSFQSRNRETYDSNHRLHALSADDMKIDLIVSIS